MPAEQGAGRQYLLPTEAEWEYACRAGGASPPAGRAELAAVAWSADDLPGMRVWPRPAQNTTQTLVLAHLHRGSVRVHLDPARPPCF